MTNYANFAAYPAACASIDLWFQKTANNTWEQIPELKAKKLIYDAEAKKPKMEEEKKDGKKEKGPSAFTRCQYATQELGDALWDTMDLEEGKRKNRVLFANGNLDLLTGAFQPYDAAELVHAKHTIGHDWDAGLLSEKCPKWEAFVSSLFENDAEAAEKAKFLQEWVGYCLMPTASLQKSLILFGRGSNGKGVISRMTQNCIGKGGRTSKLLSSLTSGFGAWELCGKYANFCAEMSRKEVIGADFKALTGGDAITAEAKFVQQQKTFRPFAKLVFSTNGLPSIFQTGEAIERRLMILSLPRQFPPVPGFEEGLAKEVRGVIAWALAGARRIAETGAFTRVDAVEKTTRHYINSYDVIGLFLEHLTEKATGETWISRADIYKKYVAWCENNGIKEDSSLTMYDKLLARDGVAERKRNNGTRGFVIQKMKGC